MPAASKAAKSRARRRARSASKRERQRAKATPRGAADHGANYDPAQNETLRTRNRTAGYRRHRDRIDKLAAAKIIDRNQVYAARMIRSAVAQRVSEVLCGGISIDDGKRNIPPVAVQERSAMALETYTRWIQACFAIARASQLGHVPIVHVVTAVAIEERTLEALDRQHRKAHGWAKGVLIWGLDIWLQVEGENFSVDKPEGEKYTRS